MLALNAVLQDRYQIIRSLVQGGMGNVYKAVDLRLNIFVALKECRFDEIELRKQFQREAQTLAKLRHSALPRVIDHFTEGRGQFLVMEFIPGEDLWERLQSRKKPFHVSTVLRWGVDLLDALAYLHRQTPQIIHRDIKPQNLKTSETGQIVLLDFGIAKTMASTSILAYTKVYAPIEQIQGTGTDARSDLYSLAATLHHLLTGCEPIDALSRLVSIAEESRDPLLYAHEINREVPESLAGYLATTMSHSRNRRPASAAEMKQGLKRFQSKIRLDSEPPRIMKRQTAPPPTIESPTPRVKPAIPVGPPQKTLRVDRSNGVPLGTPRRLKTDFVADSEGRVIDLRTPPPLISNASARVSSTKRFLSRTIRKRYALPVLASCGLLVALVVFLFWSFDLHLEPRPQKLALGGHTDSVKAVAISPDGRLIASGADDRTIRLWDSYSGRQNKVMIGHKEGIVSLAFSVDGSTLRSSDSRSYKYWSVSSGQEVDVPQSPAFDVPSAMTPSGRTLVYVRNNKIVIMNVSTREDVFSLVADTTQVNCLAISPDGVTLVTGGSDHIVRLWNLSGYLR